MRYDALLMLRIDVEAIRTNFKLLQQQQSFIAPVVKASGYGLGAKKIADILSPLGATLFVVVTLQEAKEIFPHRALVLFPREEDLGELSEIEAEIVVSSMKMLRTLCERKRAFSIHLELNSGMNRLGLTLEEINLAADMLKASPHLRLEGLMSHFTSSDIPEEDDFSKEQMTLLKEAKSLLLAKGLNPTYLHIANSFGAIRFHDPAFNLARVGLALYGALDSPLPLKHALTLESSIAAIHSLQAGESVSYGRRFVAKEPMHVAVVPLGYFDGVARSFSERGEVLIEGKRARIIGAVCMDFFMCDVTWTEKAHVGSTVTLFGKEFPVQEAAKKGGTIAHEFISRLGPRILRSFENVDMGRMSDPLEKVLREECLESVR